MALLNLLEEHGREKAGLEASFRLAVWEDLRDEGFNGCRLEFMVAPLKPNGRVNWRLAERDTAKHVYVADAEHGAWLIEWSKRTGKCAGCAGDGKQFERWHHERGTTFKTCPDCGGSGLAERSAKA